MVLLVLKPLVTEAVSVTPLRQLLIYEKWLCGY